jgi:hypothetical protein
VDRLQSEANKQANVVGVVSPDSVPGSRFQVVDGKQVRRSSRSKSSSSNNSTHSGKGFPSSNVSSATSSNLPRVPQTTPKRYTAKSVKTTPAKSMASHPSSAVNNNGPGPIIETNNLLEHVAIPLAIGSQATGTVAISTQSISYELQDEAKVTTAHDVLASTGEVVPTLLVSQDSKDESDAAKLVSTGIVETTSLVSKDFNIESDANAYLAHVHSNTNNDRIDNTLRSGGLGAHPTDDDAETDGRMQPPPTFPTPTRDTSEAQFGSPRQSSLNSTGVSTSELGTSPEEC